MQLRTQPQWRALAWCAAVAVMVGGATAYGSAWTNDNGSNGRFSWQDGNNANDLYGDPTVTEAGFFFLNPVDFRAEGGGGVGDSVTDTARWVMDVGAHDSIDFITVEEWGIWSSDISDPSDYEFDVAFDVFRFDPSPPGSTTSITIPVTVELDGTWHAEYTLVAGAAGNPPASDQPWNKMQITVVNTLQVDGTTAPAGTFIEKQGMRVIIPEPASLLFLALGLGSVAVCRSRRR